MLCLLCVRYGQTLRRSREMSGYAGLPPVKERRQGASVSKRGSQSLKAGCADLVAGQVAHIAKAVFRECILNPMQTEPLFEETIPVFILFLSNLSGLLKKGSVFAGKKGNKNSEKKLIERKLAPDMYTFTQQIGYAYFMAFETVTNLTGKQPPEFTYDEKSIKELQTSLKRATAFLRTITKKDIAFSKGKKMKTFLHQKKTFSREEYVRTVALPNFFFHVATAYDIFRHLGVPLTKEDYLGKR
jgi:hypothetical protein